MPPGIGGIIAVCYGDTTFFQRYDLNCGVPLFINVCHIHISFQYLCPFCHAVRKRENVGKHPYIESSSLTITFSIFFFIPIPLGQRDIKDKTRLRCFLIEIRIDKIGLTGRSAFAVLGIACFGGNVSVFGQVVQYRLYFIGCFETSAKSHNVTAGKFRKTAFANGIQHILTLLNQSICTHKRECRSRMLGIISAD